MFGLFSFDKLWNPKVFLVFLLLLVFCSFSFLCLLTVLRLWFCFSGTYASVSGDYELCTMLVTYDLGWLPRGLLGTLLSVFGDENAIQSAGIFTNVLVFCFLLSLIVVAVYVFRLYDKCWLLPLCFLVWPGLVVLGYRVSQPRADILMYWFFWICILVAIFKSKWLVPVTICLGTIMMFIHEGWVFLFLPFVLFLIWSFVGFKQAIITGVILLIPFLIVELLPHVGADEVVDYLINRKRVAGWYEQSEDSMSFWSDCRSETESMAYFQYGSGFSLFNLVHAVQSARNFYNISWLFSGGLFYLLLSVPQLVLSCSTIGCKFGKRLALCVLPFLLLMLGTQLDWIRFIPMYLFGFGATVFALWMKQCVESPFDKFLGCGE